MSEELGVHLILVGNGNAGKTTLLIRLATGDFPRVYTPTIFDNYSFVMTVDGRSLSVHLADTAGGEDYPRLRPLSYPGQDIFLLCFAIDDRRSFEDCPEYWLPELRHHRPDAPVLLVGCKSDLVKTTPDACIAEEEIRARAKEWGDLPYIETSALLPMCVADCFAKAVRIVWQDREQRPSKRKRRKLKPKPPDGPTIAVDESEYYTQWAAALENTENDDVTFILHSGVQVHAHSEMLTASSSFMCDVIALKGKTKDSPLQCNVSGETFNGITNVSLDPETRRININLQETISESTLKCVLLFLYTGLLTRSQITNAIISEELKTLSDLWNLPYLRTACENIENDDGYLNPSIATYLNQETCQQFKKMYLNSEDRADVVFRVEGAQIPAHRAILAARCPVLAAMLSGRYVEGTTHSEDIVLQDVDYTSFMALLEYIYTDTAPIEEGNALGIMAIADQFCQSRLVSLCELYITKNTQNALDTDIKGSIAYLLDLLNFAQRHNAKQLEAWCLHVIASNYEECKGNLKTAKLTAEHRWHIEQHRWPPSRGHAGPSYRRHKCALL